MIITSNLSNPVVFTADFLLELLGSFIKKKPIDITLVN